MARGDIWDFRKLGVVTVAVDDRLFEVRMQRRLRAGEKPGADLQERPTTKEPPMKTIATLMLAAAFLFAVEKRGPRAGGAEELAP